MSKVLEYRCKFKFYSEVCVVQDRRVKKTNVKGWIGMLTGSFTVFMVAARTISGVHWFTDIAGSVMLSAGLFCVYKAFVLKCIKK